MTDARHVVAVFPTQEAAARAFSAVDRAFTACSRAEERAIRWPALTAAGGRAEFFETLRHLSAQESERISTRFTGTALGLELGLMERYASHDFTTYAINREAISILTLSRYGSGDMMRSDFDALASNPQRNRLDVTAGFALHRLSGGRTNTANAVPARFRFADENRRFERLTSLDIDWGIPGMCTQTPGGDAFHLGREFHMLRTGMVTARWDVERQLALYPNPETAEAVAKDLRASVSSCSRWATEEAVGSDGDFVASLPRGKDGMIAVAIAQWGNAIFVATAGMRDVIPNRVALTEVDNAVDANRPLVCRVATGCT